MNKMFKILGASVLGMMLIVPGVYAASNSSDFLTNFTRYSNEYNKSAQEKFDKELNAINKEKSNLANQAKMIDNKYKHDADQLSKSINEKIKQLNKTLKKATKKDDITALKYGIQLYSVKRDAELDKIDGKRNLEIAKLENRMATLKEREKSLSNSRIERENIFRDIKHLIDYSNE